MGVHGLWELLAPVGRRVSVETLTGKKLAIDASIWMIQFMKAMRDEKGEMVRNAHILGFFRRICKLLYLRTKPVFVFDGGTPALKRRTVIARRRQRENAQAKIRKTAEKLLLNHVKAMRLKELADDLENQRQKNDIKGKKAIIEEPNMEHNTQKGNDEVPKSWNREELDEMLAASLAAEENEGLTADALTSGAARIPVDNVYEDEDDDEDEEMILPEMHGKVDPAVLAALPPSMQLDLLVQMRERLMAENRQKYQKVKKVPARFSELQIQAYLKTLAFRREIDGVQKSAAGRGIGGVQTSRIASEANREFIFSSAFTGDKQVLTSAGEESIDSEQNQSLPVNSFNRAVDEARSIARPDASNGLTEDQTGNASDHDVNTYFDERGRLRVSRRAMGIHMTRDLQRNLDLMKEIEQEKADLNLKHLNGTTTAKTVDDVLGDALMKIQNHEVENQNNYRMNNKDNETEDTSVKIGTMEISFQDTGHDYGHDDDDDIFASLVAGHPAVVDLTADHSTSLKQSLNSDSDFEWEEGVIEDKRNIVPSHCKAETKLSIMEEGTSNEVEVEWEEGFQGIQVNSSSFPVEIAPTVRKGALVEEAEIQEAIKRSLEDMIDDRTLNYPREDQEQGRSEKMVNGDNTQKSVYEAKGPQLEGPARDAFQPIESTQVYDSAETNFNKSHQNQKLLDQDVGGGGALSEELAQQGMQIFDTRGMDGNENVMNKPVDTCGGELAHDNGSSLMSYSFTDSNIEKLHDTDLVDAQHGMSHATVDGPFCRTEKSAKISATDSVTDADGTKELTKANILVDLSIENDMPGRNPSSIEVDEEHEGKEFDLQEEMIFLHKEREELGIEQRKLERNAESVSSEMFAECQELLQMFGLPYIIAPMEAEAQCAYMELLNLVDGVVTDDSDAFLFGAGSVYKNIFDNRKYVETYLLKDIENELGLNREKLINMALLLGSDYTEGVSGIGIVNAMEVVNAFPEENGLHEFRKWIESPDPTILRNFDGQGGGKSKGKGSKDNDTLKSCSSGDAEESSCDQNDIKMMKQIFMDKHRNVSKNWHVPSSFPSDAVISAYTSPQVDKSNESFSWGKPDLFALRKLCWEKIGWGSSKADELLLPVLKEYNKHETQLRLEAFYTFNERFAKIRSKRIKKAVKGITGNKSSELMDEEMPQQSRVGKKRKVKPIELEVETSGTGSIEPTEHTGTANQISTKKETNVGLSKGRRRKENASQLDGSNLQQSTSIDQRFSIKGKSGAGGKQKARRRRKEIGRGLGKRNPHFEDSETSHDDDDDDGCREKDGGLNFDISEESHQVRRRSGRLHTVVNYCIPDEFDDHDEESEVDKDTITKDSSMEPCADGKETYVDGVEDPGIGREDLVDETEQENMIDKRDSSTQDDDYSGNVQSMREYLQFGGGFCLDKEGEDIELGGLTTSATGETTSEKFNMVTGFHPVEEEKPEIGSSNLNLNQTANLRRTDASDTQIMNDNVDDDSNVSSTMLMDSLKDAGDDHESRSKGFLRAMPNLRRKRKKT